MRAHTQRIRSIGRVLTGGIAATVLAAGLVACGSETADDEGGPDAGTDQSSESSSPSAETSQAPSQSPSGEPSKKPSGKKPPKKGSAGGEDKPDAAKPRTDKDTLALESFAQRIKQKNVVLLDVRTPAEFKAGHIPGATNMDASAKDFDNRLMASRFTGPIAIYCASGRRSAEALKRIHKHGFTDAVELAGGFTAWQQAGKPVKK